MTDRILGKILACILAVMLPAATMSAETHAAMLFTTNTVMLNGVSAARSSAVYSGDTIQTPAESAVTLTSEGNTVMVGPSSLLVYEGNAVRLNSGSTLITTEKRMKTQVQKLVVTPASEGRSTYRVARSSGQVVIAALRGSVSVSDGASVKTVAEGNTTTVADPAPAPAPQATPGAGGGGTIGGVSTGLAIALGIGAAVAATLIAVETTKTPVSGP